MTDQGKPGGYAGDLSPADAWRMLEEETRARLIDVRTQAEWSWVGLPDLAALEKQVLLVSWQVFPGMARNEAFAQQIAEQGVLPFEPVILICRSGIRSRAAAEFLTAAGYSSCYNVTDGFEGPLDDHRHRGTKGGWKSAGLPWLQG